VVEKKPRPFAREQWLPENLDMLVNQADARIPAEWLPGEVLPDIPKVIPVQASRKANLRGMVGRASFEVEI